MPPLPANDHEQASTQSPQVQSPLLAASGASNPVAAAAAAAPPSNGSTLRLALQNLQGSDLQNLLLQQASPDLLLGGASQSTGLVEALLARRQLEQAMLLHPSLSLTHNGIPHSSLSSSLLGSMSEQPNSASTDASTSSGSSESSPKLPPGLEALCAATDSTLAIRALEAAAQQRLQQQQATELLLSRLLDGNNSGRPGGQM